MNYLCVSDVAKRSGLSVSFLNKLRILGGGPPFAKIGAKAVRYPADKLDAWLAACERRSTSDTPPPAKAEPTNRPSPPPRRRRRKVNLQPAGEAPK
jgi:hypothetical protein